MSVDLLALLHDGPFIVARRTYREDPEKGWVKAGWRNILVDSPEAAHKLLQEENRKKRDAYVHYARFGPATTKTGQPSCKTDNIHGCRTFMCDVDGSPEHNPQISYPTLADAWTGIMAMMRQAAADQIPSPNAIVCTGHGYHLAWVLDDELGLGTWEQYRAALYGWLQTTGLRFDPQGGSIEQSLRYAVMGVDIYNWRTENPARVGLIHLGDQRISAAVFQAALGRYAAGPGGSATVNPRLRLAVDNTVEQDFGEWTDGAPFDLRAAIPECGQLYLAVSKGGRDSGYKFWIDTLHLSRRHHDEADGLGLAHAFSSGHPDYDPDQVEEKFRSFGPTGGIVKCSTLRRDSPCPHICQGCPYWDDPKGPGEGSVAKIPGELTRRQFAAMRLPHPAFSNTAHGLEQTIQGEHGPEQRLVLRGYHITEVELHEPKDADADSSLDAVAQLVFQLSVVGATTGPGSGGAGRWKRQMIVSVTEGGNTSKLQTATSRQGLILGWGQANVFQQTLQTWIQALRDQQDIRQSYHRLGWSGDRQEFVLGDRVFLADGTSREVAAGLERSGFTTRGRWADWDRIAGLVMQHEARPQAHALLATPFAAPLLCLTGVPGVVVNFHSPTSGHGKTILARLAASVWGHWRAFHQTVDDTTGSLQRKLAILHHLPSYFDEVRVADRREFFNNLVFRIGQGSEKKRLTSDIRLQEAGHWATMVVTCTNFSLAGVLGGKNAAGDAAQARALDLEMPRLRLQAGGPSVAAVQQEIDQLTQHYGWAGREYAAYIVRNRASIEAFLRVVMDGLLTQGRSSPSDAAGRYQAAAGACLIVGAAIAQQLGLMPYLDELQVVDAVQQAMTKANVARHEAQQRTGCDDVIREFLKVWQPASLMTAHTAPPKPQPGQLPQQPTRIVHHSQREFRPKLPLAYEIDTQAKQLLVDADLFEDWVRERGLDPFELRREIVAKKYAFAQLALAEGVQSGGKRRVFILPAGPKEPYQDFMPT